MEEKIKQAAHNYVIKNLKLQGVEKLDNKTLDLIDFMCKDFTAGAKWAIENVNENEF